MTKELSSLTIEEAARGLRAKEFSVRELYDACVDAITKKDAHLHAYLEVFPADERAIAESQKRIDAGNAPLLCGIPIALKDNILYEGHLVSAASKMLENYRASYDATIITKLKKEGVLFLGRTNMDEFALGSSTEHSAFGRTNNPYDQSRIPGGSSGGSAAAVSANLAIAALGSDTGGSIRQPASHCGIVGLKPTYGAVSRYGLMAMGSSLDQIGPLAKTVADAKIIHEAIVGIDPMDSTTLPENLYAKRAVPEKFRIGVPRALLKTGVDADVLAQFENTLSALKKAGHTLVDIELPTSAYGLAAYYVVMPAELSTNLSRLDGMRYGLHKKGDTLLADYVQSRTEGFGPETIRRILLGTFVLSSGYIDAYYRKANAARMELRKEYQDAFAKVDVIAFPTTPAPAFVAGEKSHDPVSMYLEDIFTVTANLTGLPALSVPMGFVERGDKKLPIGMHFTASWQEEDHLFTIGEAVEKISK